MTSKTFGNKDLLMLLSDNAGDLSSLRHTEDHTILQLPEQKLDKSKKVQRYFAGKKPIFVKEDENELPKQIIPVLDRRLQRLSQNETNNVYQERRVFDAEVIDDFEEDENKEEKEEELIEKLMAESEREEENNNNNDNNNNSFDVDYESRRKQMDQYMEDMKKRESGNSKLEVYSRNNIFQEEEYETESEDEDEDEDVVKPVYIPKNQRESNKELLKQQEKMQEFENMKKIQIQGRVNRTREIVAETIRRSEEVVEVTEVDDGKPDDTDDVNNNAEEYEKWKIREINRLKRDSEVKEAFVFEQKELERRRNLTDEERMEEDKKNGRFDVEEKKKWKFLQKYYHKGAFYMDDSSTQITDSREREFDEPTLEDRFNKESLPSVLQVKKFGMRGRTKYTHLVDQDTTEFRDPLANKDTLKDNFYKRAAGLGDIYSGNKKKKI